MQLQHLSFAGVVQQSSSVDSFLQQQGFRKHHRQNTLFYDTLIQDSSTRASYALRIPFTLHDPYIRFGTPYLVKKMFLEKLHPRLHIPWSVWRSAEHKLAEIADYLRSDLR